jgi:hypothetical protein
VIRADRLVATPTQLIIAINSLKARQRGRVAREQVQREGNDAEVRRRLETELILTQARIAAEQAEARSRFEAAQRSAELVAKADDCRRHCPQKLSDMVRELRSLGTAEGGVNRFRELGLEYQAMVGEMPTDVKQGLAAEMERFALLLQEYEPTMRKAERDLEAKRLAAEEKLRQEKLVAEEKLKQETLVAEENLKQKKAADERRSQLALFYVLYMQLQFCAERLPNFSEAKVTARDMARNMESGFSTAQTTEIWRATAQSFANLEPLLKTTSNLFGECIGASNALAGMVLSGQGKVLHTQGPRKDF